jgi:hypothetical protein
MKGEGRVTCAGECSMNYWCGEASTSPTQNECPSNSESSAGSGMITNCLCSHGYEGENGGPCNMCPIGRWKSQAGSGPCITCPSNSSTMESGTTSINNCICNLGHTSPTGLNGTACEPCSVGSYKDVMGPDQCIVCPFNSTSIAGSIWCQCNDGFSSTNDHHQCIQLSIISGTLQLRNESIIRYTDDGELLLPSIISSNSLLEFQTSGNFTLADPFQPVIGHVVITFGSILQPQQFHCLTLRHIRIDERLSNITCVLPTGYGQHLLFHMWLIGMDTSMILLSRTSSISILDMFAYPIISIEPKSLRRSVSAFGGDLLIAATNFLSESISFDGHNFINDASLHITYGPIESPKSLACLLTPSQTTSTTLTCLTEASSITGRYPLMSLDYDLNSSLTLIQCPSSSGGHQIKSDMHFMLSLFGSDIYGLDVYRFPIVPELLVVWGCNDTYPPTNNATRHCPTQGPIFDFILEESPT